MKRHESKQDIPTWTPWCKTEQTTTNVFVKIIITFNELLRHSKEMKMLNENSMDAKGTCGVIINGERYKFWITFLIIILQRHLLIVIISFIASPDAVNSLLHSNTHLKHATRHNQ